MVALRPRLTPGPHEELWTPSQPNVRLLMSGNEISPYVRRFGKEGDGLNPNEPLGKAGYGVWPAATNLVANGGFETNTTGWVFRNGNETLTRITSDHKFGSACMKVDVTSSIANSGAYFALTVVTGTTYTASMWAKAGAGKTLRIALWDATSGFQNADFTATGDWQRLTISGQFGATTGRVYIMDIAVENASMFIDGVQVEVGSIATPYIETAGAPASRSAARMRVPNIRQYLNETQGWVALLYRAPYADTALPNGGPRIFEWGSSADRLDCYDDGSLSMRNVVSSVTEAGSTTRTYSANSIVSAIGGWTATQLKASSNGAAFTSATRSAGVPAISATAMELGQSQIVDRFIDGTLLAAVLGCGPLIDANAAALNQILRRIYQNPELVPETAFPGGCTLVWPGHSEWAYGRDSLAA